jgi:hypothetical protein
MGSHYRFGRYNSTTMGFGTTASGDYSTAMGENTTAKSAYETVVGRYNSDYTPQDSLTGMPATVCL